MGRLMVEDQGWLGAGHKAAFREIADRITRFVEDLDAIRERAAVVQDELMNRISDHMNRTMYLLTVVASIMLPLGAVTGLLGVNVGGIPGSDNPWAFAILVTLLVLVVLAQVIVFRKLRWI
jgi:zinc transporter